MTALRWISSSLFFYSATVFALGCNSDVGGPNPPPPPGDTLIGVPLMDMSGDYHGFTGGLYPGEVNVMPAEHLDTGLRLAAEVQPRDASGAPDPDGEIVMMSLGMSNTREHWNAFMDDANGDSELRSELVLVQGAASGQVAANWESPNLPGYNNAAQGLEAAGVTAEQVQTIWLLQANRQPTVSLPDPGADAFELLERLGNVVRAAKVVYPNLKQIFFSSRIYSCARTGLNPEPYAYESGFSVKWLIEAQINQMENGTVDPAAGDLDYDSGVAPWIGWSAYLWADGSNPRSDGLFWVDSDLLGDCTHPSSSGTAKASTLLLEFFRTSPLSTGWFLEN